MQPKTPAYFTVAEIRDRLRFAKSESVLALIHGGQLAATNVSASPGRATWRVSADDLAKFLEQRKAVPAPPVTRRAKKRSEKVTQYF